MPAPALLPAGRAAGAPQWQVPDVVGDQVAAARTELQSYRFTVQEVLVYSEKAKDEVVSTAPPAGDVLPERGRLVVRVSAGLPPGAVDVGAVVTRIDAALGELDARTQQIASDVTTLLDRVPAGGGPQQQKK